MKLKHNAIERMEVDGKDCMVACFEVLETPSMKHGESKKTKKPYTIASLIEPYYERQVPFRDHEGEWTVSFQVSRFINPEKKGF